MDKSETALLMADFAIIGIGENPMAQERHTLDIARPMKDAEDPVLERIAFGIAR